MRCCVFILVLSIVAGSAYGGVVHQPVSAGTTMGTSAGSLDNLFNQSGLSETYTSGVTDFDEFIARGPVHDSADANNTWTSGSGIAGSNEGVVDFDLGGSITLESIAVWNHFNDGSDQAVMRIVIMVANDATFDDAQFVGFFDVAHYSESPVPAHVFAFEPIAASHVRLVISSNYGNEISSQIGEIVFERAIPAPATLALLAGGALMRRRRRCRV